MNRLVTSARRSWQRRRLIEALDPRLVADAPLALGLATGFNNHAHAEEYGKGEDNVTSWDNELVIAQIPPAPSGVFGNAGFAAVGLHAVGHSFVTADSTVVFNDDPWSNYINAWSEGWSGDYETGQGATGEITLAAEIGGNDLISGEATGNSGGVAFGSSGAYRGIAQGDDYRGAASVGSSSSSSAGVTHESAFFGIDGDLTMAVTTSVDASHAASNASAEADNPFDSQSMTSEARAAGGSATANGLYESYSGNRAFDCSLDLLQSIADSSSIDLGAVGTYFDDGDDSFGIGASFGVNHTSTGSATFDANVGIANGDISGGFNTSVGYTDGSFGVGGSYANTNFAFTATGSTSYSRETGAVPGAQTAGSNAIVGGGANYVYLDANSSAQRGMTSGTTVSLHDVVGARTGSSSTTSKSGIQTGSGASATSHVEQGEYTELIGNGSMGRGGTTTGPESSSESKQQLNLDATRFGIAESQVSSYGSGSASGTHSSIATIQLPVAASPLGAARPASSSSGFSSTVSGSSSGSSTGNSSYGTARTYGTGSVYAAGPGSTAGYDFAANASAGSADFLASGTATSTSSSVGVATATFDHASATHVIGTLSSGAHSTFSNVKISAVGAIGTSMALSINMYADTNTNGYVDQYDQHIIGYSANVTVEADPVLGKKTTFTNSIPGTASFDSGTQTYTISGGSYNQSGTGTSTTKIFLVADASGVAKTQASPTASNTSSVKAGFKSVV